jgi:hypothetical protein
MTLVLYLILSLVLPPCQHEDNANCKWSADTSGNGRGASFVSITIPGGDVLIYHDGDVRIF